MCKIFYIYYLYIMTLKKLFYEYVRCREQNCDGRHDGEGGEDDETKPATTTTTVNSS